MIKENGLNPMLIFLLTIEVHIKIMVNGLFPVYPTSRSIQGSPPTPYIFDDRCKWEDATKRIKEVL